MTPDALPIKQALSQSDVLVRLEQSIRDSKARLDAIRPVLPPAIVGHVAAGPIDEKGWSLLVANGAVAAKLRQLLPALEEHLHESGWSLTTIRIKVRTDWPQRK